MKKSKHKRVLMLLENAPFPFDDRVRHEAVALLAGDYQVTVISPGTKVQPRHEIQNSVEIYRFPFPPDSKGLLGYLWEYGYSMIAIFLFSLYVFAKDGFDIIHTAQPPDTFVFIALFYKLFGKLYVLDHHDLAPELYHAHFRGKGSNIIYHILIWLEQLSFRFADHLISTNESYKEIALQRGHVEERRITVVRNGPDLKELSSSADTKQDLRRDGRIIIGYVGVTGIQDGVDNLIRTVDQLVHHLGRTDILCLILGDGGAMPDLKSLTRQLGLTSHILFTGWIKNPDEIAEYFKVMDICVAPEPSDPYNNRSTAAKIMEYMAMGKPVVSSNLPEHRFTAQEAAVYAAPGDPKDFANKIVELISDPAQRKTMGRAGQARIEAELAWPHQAKQLLKAYATLDAIHKGNKDRPKVTDATT